MSKRINNVSSVSYFFLLTLLPLLLAACVDSGSKVPPALTDDTASEWTDSLPLPGQSQTPDFSNYEYQEDLQPTEDALQEGWIDYRDFDFGSRASEVDSSEKEVVEATSPVSSSYSKPSPSSHDFASYAHLAKLVLVVDKATRADSETGQSLTVFKNGSYSDTFLVSTGVEEWTLRKSGENAGEKTWTGTIEGFFRPTRMYDTYHSRAWGGASMPNAVFFYGGIAFHGTWNVSKLGEQDSKGCVRLSRENALKVRTFIQETGTPENIWMEDEDVESLENPGEMLERTRVLGTTVDLPAVDKKTGQLLHSQLVPTWDTIVVVLDTSN